MNLIRMNALISLDRIMKMQMDYRVYVIPANGVFRLPPLRKVEYWVN